MHWGTKNILVTTKVAYQRGDTSNIQEYEEIALFMMSIFCKQGAYEFFLEGTYPIAPLVPVFGDVRLAPLVSMCYTASMIG